MKDFVISHIKDNDGLSPIILMHLIGRDFDYKLLDIYDVDTYINQFLDEDLSMYENIYILDLTLSEEIYKKIDASLYKDKMKVFDHHLSHMFANEKNYVTIDVKECASSLFYQYLKQLYSFDTPCIQTYISLVKSLDLYTFEEDGNKDAPYLSDLLHLYGVDIYISKMVERLKQKEFSFDAFEKQWFLLDERNRDEYIEKRCEKMILIDVGGYKGGIVFAENYRNELAHFMLERYDIDFAACINMQGGVSLRSNGKIDLSLFAGKYAPNGGGHRNAAGFGVSRQLQETVVQTLFFDGKMIDESH